MVHLLTEELVRRGHDVNLFASGDSRTSANLRAICDYNVMEMMARGEAYEYECYAMSSFADALREADSFDLIHCHLGFSGIPLSVLSRIPILHTIHTAVTVDNQWVLKRYPDASVVAISHTQVACVPAERRQNMRVIYNSCDVNAYEFSETPGKYLAFLGRMGAHKNPLDAILVAKEVGLPIILAGLPMTSDEEIYFTEKVKPLIDGKNVIHIGPVNHSEKKDFLKNAAAFLFPIKR